MLNEPIEIHQNLEKEENRIIYVDLRLFPRISPRHEFLSDIILMFIEIPQDKVIVNSDFISDCF